MLVLGRLKLGQCRKLMRLNLSCADVIKETDEVLNQALAYTRTLVAELSPPVLHEFGLRAALRWLAGQMERYQLMVAVDIQGRTEWPLAEDRAVLLFQSIRELLINISKHARTDRAIVRLRAEGDILRIEVQDEGRGFSLPVSVPGASESTKFGLFSIGERMKALGGQFHIESAPGRGTTATLLLPLERQQPLIPDATQETAQVPGTQPPVASIPAAVPNKARTIRVLLVDDHVMLRQGLRTIVTGYDHLDVVGEAGDGLDAIRLAGTLKPDVIVMDINMPKLDGIEATKRIRDGHRDIAIIGLSVHQSADIAQKMSEAGAVAYLTKESAADDLCKAIESAAEAVRQ
jgi:CheY-like chemotaxis protein